MAEALFITKVGLRVAQVICALVVLGCSAYLVDLTRQAQSAADSVSANSVSFGRRLHMVVRQPLARIITTTSHATLVNGHSGSNPQRLHAEGLRPAAAAMLQQQLLALRGHAMQATAKDRPLLATETAARGRQLLARNYSPAAADATLGYALFCGISGLLLSTLLLALMLKPAWRPTWFGDLAELIITAVWCIFFLAAGAAIANWGTCPTEFGRVCDSLNGAQAFSWISWLLWAASAVLLGMDWWKGRAGGAPGTSVRVVPRAATDTAAKGTTTGPQAQQGA